MIVCVVRPFRGQARCLDNTRGGGFGMGPDALLLDYYPRNSPHAAMVQPASETECLILVAAGVRMCLSLTTTHNTWGGAEHMPHPCCCRVNTGMTRST